MSREEIIKAFKDKNITLGTDEDRQAFAELNNGHDFTNDIELSLKYGSYFMSKYGNRVTVEWDIEKEGFNSL